MISLLEKAMATFKAGRDLDPTDAEPFFDELIGSDSVDILNGVLAAWVDKGFSADELFSMANIMRSRMTRVIAPDGCVDIVGTGGSSAKTFNVSTAAAFVTVGANAKVAKHGNRAATSNAGSADALEQLGVKLAVR